MISPLAVALGALSLFFIGGLWYSPLLFGKPWMRLNGFSEADLKAGSPARIFGGSLLLSVLATAAFAVFLGPDVRPVDGLLYGGTAGLAWVGAGYGITGLFERRPLRLLAINAGYHTVAFAVMGLILGATGGG